MQRVLLGFQSCNKCFKPWKASCLSPIKCASAVSLNFYRQLAFLNKEKCVYYHVEVLSLDKT